MPKEEYRCLSLNVPVCVAAYAYLKSLSLAHNVIYAARDNYAHPVTCVAVFFLKSFAPFLIRLCLFAVVHDLQRLCSGVVPLPQVLRQQHITPAEIVAQRLAHGHVVRPHAQGLAVAHSVCQSTQAKPVFDGGLYRLHRAESDARRYKLRFLH